MVDLSTPYDLSPPEYCGLPSLPCTQLVCDRFQGLFAVGFGQNFVKVWGIHGLERTIKCPTTVTHLQFFQNRGLLAGSTLSGTSPAICVWVINTGAELCPPFKLPENDPVATMHVPDLDLVPATCSDSSEIIYVGTNSGQVYTVFVAERSVKRCPSLEWRSLFPYIQKLPAFNPVMSILVHRRKPHRILLSYKFTGAVIWNIKKNAKTQTVNIARTEVLDAAWAYELKAVALAYSSGDVVFFNTKGKLRAPLLSISVSPEPLSKIFWLRYDSTAPLLVSLTSSGKVFINQVGKMVSKQLAGFAHGGCATLFAGDVYSTYTESSNGQSKNSGKAIYFRLLTGVSRSRDFLVYNLDQSSVWSAKTPVADRPLFPARFPCQIGWTVPAGVQYVPTVGKCDSPLLSHQLIDLYKDNIKKQSINDDGLLSYLKMYYQTGKKTYEHPLMSDYELVDSVVTERAAKVKSAAHKGMLFVNDISGRLGIYAITDGGMVEVYRFKERIFSFDFEAESKLLAVGMEHKVVVYTTEKSVLVSELRELQAEYTYETRTFAKQVIMVPSKTSSPSLVIATSEGNLVIANLAAKTNIVINTNLNSLDAIACLATSSDPDIEVTFATRLGMIGWCSAGSGYKVDSVSSPLLSSADPKLTENSFHKIWALHDPCLIIYAQRNTICLCEKDQHNCLCLFKSLNAKDELLAVELLNKNQQLAYSTLNSSLISVVSTANLEPVATIETSLPSIFAMKWTNDSLVLVGYNIVAMYETYYKETKNEKTVEIFDVKKMSHLTMASAKKYGSFESIKAILEKQLGKGSIKVQAPVQLIVINIP